jgi:hypothetical protein
VQPGGLGKFKKKIISLGPDPATLQLELPETKMPAVLK